MRPFEMERERWRLIDRAFEELLDLPAEHRTAHLERIGAADADLRRELEALLLADQRARTTFDGLGRELLRAGLTRVAAPADPPAVEGYEVLREIGRGGMGSVHLARTLDGAVLVAIKRIRPEELGATSLLRFRAEARMLARLEHPNIARFHAAGATADGLPYVVMEFVDGLPIDAYCDRHSLGVEARLALFHKVCSAVQHAHENLLAHRDLKPSNVLVDARGEPKLLDFGIAKPLPGDPDAASGTTGTAERVMTLEYASPEHVRGERITAASDVYSLGVLLYRLLTGRSPYRPPRRHVGGLAALVCDQEPLNPSLAVRAETSPRDGAQSPTEVELAAARGGLRPRELERRLRGDLDHVVLRALSKEPSRRYRSAEQLSEDLRRHLAQLPVAAKRGERLYRARKFARRNRTALAACAAIAAIVVAFSVSSVRQASRTRAERDKARRTLELMLDLFASAAPSDIPGRDVKARDVLDRASARLASEMSDDPDIRATLMDAIGQVYLGLALYDEAETHLEGALEIRRRSRSHDPALIAASQHQLGVLAHLRGNYSAAESHLRDALSLRSALGREDPAGLIETLDALGNVYVWTNRFDEARVLHERALELCGRDVGARTRADALDALSKLELRLGRLDEAERTGREALALLRGALPPTHHRIAVALNGLGAILGERSHDREAKEVLEEALAIARVTLPPDHPDLTAMVNNLGTVCHGLDELERAEQLLREAVDARRKRLGPHHPKLAVVLANLGLTMLQAGRLDEADALQQEALAIRWAAFGESNHMVANSLSQLAAIEEARGSPQVALDYYAYSRDILERLHGGEHPHLAYPLLGMSRCALALGEGKQAAAHAADALALRRRVFAPASPSIAEAAGVLGECLVALDRYGEAELFLEESYEIWRERTPVDTKRLDQACVRIERLWQLQAAAREIGASRGSHHDPETPMTEPQQAR